MAFNALPPSRLLSLRPTQRLLVFGTQSRLPNARRFTTPNGDYSSSMLDA